MKTMISASDHFASWCWVIVFPVPNPPGIAARRPYDGKKVSMMRWPVMSGSVMRNRQKWDGAPARATAEAS